MTDGSSNWFEGYTEGDSNVQFLAELGSACDAEAKRLGVSTINVDLQFLVFLRRFSRFGFFHFGPIAIDVNLIEEIVERTIPRGPKAPLTVLGDDVVRLSRAVIGEAQKTGRTRIDELHYLLAFMRFPEGLPARVFGELGVTPEQVERFAANRTLPGRDAEKLYSPEEAAEYLGVHVQTVRGWIRSGRLKASRLAGQRALRIRATDVQSVLEPVDPTEV
ncbi:MAG: helix-turn-helix domain-containing protein [bacterium]